MWRNLPTGRQVGRRSRLKICHSQKFFIMYFVYAIKSISRNYIYVGLTDNLERRLAEHNDGKNKTTKPYSPFVVLHIEQVETRELARSREKFLKSGVGKEYLKTLLK